MSRFTFSWYNYSLCFLSATCSLYNFINYFCWNQITSIYCTYRKSSPISSLLSPFLFCYFVTITQCKTHAFLRYHCWWWGSQRVSQTTECNQQRSDSLTEYNATVWRGLVVCVLNTEAYGLTCVIYLSIKLKQRISIRSNMYTYSTAFCCQ